MRKIEHWKQELCGFGLTRVELVAAEVLAMWAFIRLPGGRLVCQMSSHVSRLQFQPDVQKLGLAAKEEYMHVLLCVFYTQSSSYLPERNPRFQWKMLLSAHILWQFFFSFFLYWNTYADPHAMLPFCWSACYDNFCLPSQSWDKAARMKKNYASLFKYEPFWNCTGKNVTWIKERKTLLAAKSQRFVTDGQQSIFLC